MSTPSDEDLIEKAMERVRHLSLTAAAKEIGGGISRDVIGGWRNGRRGMETGTRVAVMAYLGFQANASEGEASAYRRGIQRAIEVLERELESLPPTANGDVPDLTDAAKKMRFEDRGEDGTLPGDG